MRLLIAGVLIVVGLVPPVAGGNGGKVTICHKGATLSVNSSAVKAHLKHGDKVGKCSTVPPGGGGGNGGGDIPVTTATFAQVNRILACADRVVIRHADNHPGIAVDLDLATFQSGFYEGAKFTVARYYAGIGATCDKLGGAPTGAFVNDYPVWR